MSIHHWGENIEQFYQLTPDVVFENLEQMGFRPTGKLSQLNSLENRVYDVELSKPLFDQAPYATHHLVLKYYRPGRWNIKTLKEEHAFYQELSDYEVPVIAPFKFEDETLFFDKKRNLFWCAFPKVMGRIKDEFSSDETKQLGRLIGRVHNIGKLNDFHSRPIYEAKTYLDHALMHLKTSTHFPQDLKPHYESLLSLLIPCLLEQLTNLPKQRLHGDFHRGNILWTSDGPWITDLDDSLMGPVEQDLWLLFPGNDSYLQERREEFIKAYEEMTRSQVHLSFKKIEALRSMRLINFTLWIDLRYDDPFFKKMFPHFAEKRYFEQHLNDIRECIALMRE
jgi:Ser/Thr protein kinase RdoA (MazF antagonist)